MVKFGPRKSKRLATRPAMTFASSPGIVSSVISANRDRYPLRVSWMIAARVASGSMVNDGADASSRNASGNSIR